MYLLSTQFVRDKLILHITRHFNGCDILKIDKILLKYII